jgi:hypothetical protein
MNPMPWGMGLAWVSKFIPETLTQGYPTHKPSGYTPTGPTNVKHYQEGGAKGVSTSSMTLWMAQQCQWVQEACEMEANVVQAAEEMEVAQEEVVQAAQEEAAEVEGKKKKKCVRTCWGQAGDNIRRRVQIQCHAARQDRQWLLTQGVIASNN